MRVLNLIPPIALTIALAACSGENQGWNPNYRAEATPYGDYLRARESALTGKIAEPPRGIPIALPDCPRRPPASESASRRAADAIRPSLASGRQASSVPPMAQPPSIGENTAADPNRSSGRLRERRPAPIATTLAPRRPTGRCTTRFPARHRRQRPACRARLRTRS